MLTAGLKRSALYHERWYDPIKIVERIRGEALILVNDPDAANRL